MKKAVSLVLCLIAIIRIYAQPADSPYVILVSFDGFRYDYLSKFNVPSFTKFAAEGVRSEGLIPSFPSKTFPNHYTVVTGLYPGRHGLVDNSFYDPELKEYYTMKNAERVRNKNYYGGIPLWELAKQHQLKSASYFWVGTEVSGKNPEYYYAYNESIADTVRVDQVLSWLNLPSAERPHFITLYFSSPDHEGHTFGPLSIQTQRAVENADQLLNRLLVGVDKINLPINIIVVSDHGMSNLKQRSESYIFLDEILNLNTKGIKIVNSGTHAHMYVDDIHSRDSLYSLLKAKAKTFSVLKQSEYPSHWHYANKRSGDLLITAHEGYYIRDQDRAKFVPTLDSTRNFGVHGYDPHKVKDMHGIFLAKGPNIKTGQVIPTFENIHIYPLIAKILGLKLPEIDGEPKVLEKVYQKKKQLR